MSCIGPASTNAVPSTGWPANGKLARRREDTDSHVPARLGRVAVHRLGVVDLPGERLEQRLGYLTRVGEDAELVPLERTAREDVAEDVAEALGHGSDSTGRMRSGPAVPSAAPTTHN